MTHNMKRADFEGLDHKNYDFPGCITRKNRNEPYFPLDVAAALHVTHGSFIHMSVLLGRTRTNIRDYVFANPVMKEIFNEVREGMLDAVESSVFASALAGDTANQRFLLSTLGKDRGYSTRHEAVGKDGGPIRTVTSEMTPEEAAEAYASSLHNE